MPKTNKKSVKATPKKQGKKSISKKSGSSIDRSKTIMFTKKTSHKAPKSPAKPKAIKDWEPGYKKEI